MDHKRVRKTMRWVVVHSIWMLCIALWLFKGHEGAGNVFKLFTGACALINPIAALAIVGDRTGSNGKTMAQSSFPPDYIPPSVLTVMDVGASGLLAWHGHMVWAAINLWTLPWSLGIRGKIIEAWKEEQKCASESDSPAPATE